MQETTRVFAVLGDAPLRRHLQQQWRGSGTTLCGMHSEGGDSLVEEIVRVRPDVVLIDVEADGAKPLIQIVSSRRRVPVVALVRAQQPSFTALRVFEWGAVNAVPRECDNIAELGARLDQAVHEASIAQVVDMIDNHFPLSGAFPDAAVFDVRRRLQQRDPASKIVVLCAGLGGPVAVWRILRDLKTAVVSPIVVAQRMPEMLATGLAQWLEHHSGAQVVRAVSGPLEVRGVYIVPSGYDARVESHAGRPTLVVAPASHPATPNFDALFESVATTYADRAIAALLTGLGVDGVEGLRSVRRAGGLTIAQDRVSSWVHETASLARDGGAAIECLPINEIAERILMLMRTEPAHRA